MAHNAIGVANRIICFANADLYDLISNMKVQKILYYMQGFHLALYDKPLFEEDIYAWMYGPVVPVAYEYLKKYGSGHIELSEDDFQKHYIEFSGTETKLMTDVWDAYGQYTAYRLMLFTHDELPWRSTKKDSIISHQKLKDYFVTQLEEIAE